MQCLPIDNGIEVAFAGYSNAGKSSVLNTLSNQKKLVKISKKPGNTKLINLFEVNPGIRLVDLPGYGYAAVPEKLKIKWQSAMRKYLQKRTNLQGIVVLMDIRHPMKSLDQEMIQFAVEVNLPIFVLLTKADKLTTSACRLQLNKVRHNLALLACVNNVQVEIFSSIKKQGVDKLRKKLNDWFCYKQFRGVGYSLLCDKLS